MGRPGPHLLGRLPTTPDRRDFRASNFLGIGREYVEGVDPVLLLDSAKSELALTTVSYKQWAARTYADVTQTHWWRALNFLALAKQAVTPPTPPPPSGDVIWRNPDQPLDQGDTPHCGGFGGCQWGNTEPITDHYSNNDGHLLYYEAVKIGTGGKDENGVQSRWVAQALQARRRLATYAFASDVPEVGEWVRTKGPVMVGSDWTNQMFDPNPDGFVTPTGAVAGGHFWVICGDVFSQGYFLCLNSWGSSWGQGGYFKITYSDFGKLLAGVSYPGDAIMSPELAL